MIYCISLEETDTKMEEIVTDEDRKTNNEIS